MFISGHTLKYITICGLWVLLAGCKSSNKVTLPDCVIENQQAICNGGYSYWISPLHASNQNATAITGVIKDGRKSKQWISFFDNDFTEVLSEHGFNNLFRADEHNAPAVLSLPDEKWIVARTGHDDTVNGESDLVELTIFNHQFDLESVSTLATSFGSTYVQLQLVNDILYLLNRDTKEGWGIAKSYDMGITWSNWQRLSLPKGISYALLKKEQKEGQLFERLILHSGNHPEDINQNIAFSYLDLGEDDPQALVNKQVKLVGPAERSSANFNVVFASSSDKATNIRFLDAMNEQGNICHLYSTSMSDNSWQLSLVVSSSDSSELQHYVVGRYQGVLGDNDYITGATLKSCLQSGNEVVQAIIAHTPEEAHGYQIDITDIDTTNGLVFNTEKVYSSDKILYRPVYLSEHNKLMFNEADYWHHYEDWKASQIIINLPR